MNWRELLKSQTPTQYPQNTQKEQKGDDFGNIGDIEHRNENKKMAQGYGCAGCGNRIYKAVNAWEMRQFPAGTIWEHEHQSVIHWRCEQCQTIYEIIGGSKGPEYIN